MRFVPNYPPSFDVVQLARLTELIVNSCKPLALTGAGLSTESGLPDYRSEGVGLYSRSHRRPIDFQTFLRSPTGRQRYWARNFIGWPYYSQVVPNQSHRVLAKWHKIDKLSAIITQNVDRLHHVAAAVSADKSSLVELHGNNHEVECLQCNWRCSRDHLQRLLLQLNPSWTKFANQVNQDTVAPDGDVMLSDDLVSTFKVPDCPNCESGILKPTVVLFGENVPSQVKQKAHSLVSNCDLLLCLGTSLQFAQFYRSLPQKPLQTYSSYRLTALASKLKLPIVLINIGPTRADSLATVKIIALLSDVLTRVDQQLQLITDASSDIL